MSRSASDATRFTATAPHAYSRTSTSRPQQPHSRQIPPSPNTSHKYVAKANSAQAPNQSGGGGNGGGGGTSPRGPTSKPTETPAQKVARLRAAHAAKRASEISTWDKVVVRSRMVADTAHRWTVMGLITLTVIAGGITVFSLGDMILYNRRKRKLFYQEQHLMRKQRLMDAMAAEAAGRADEDQVLLLNQERTAMAFEEEKKRKKGWWKSLKGAFGFEGMRKEDVGSLVGVDLTDQQQQAANGGVQMIGADAAVMETVTGERPQLVVAQVASSPSSSPNELKTTSSILRAVEEQRRAGEKELLRRGAHGGQLDKLAEGAVGSVTSTTPASVSRQDKGSSWWG